MFTNLANELGHHLVSVLSGNMWVKGGHKFCVCVCVCVWQTKKTSNLTNLMFERNLNHL